MYKIVSRLLIYGDMPKDTILMQLADIIRKADNKSQTREEAGYQNIYPDQAPAPGGDRLCFRQESVAELSDLSADHQ